MLYWNHILGHQRVRNVLSRAIETNRLHHGYLFSGPAGVGKFTFARALAATLNCERRPEGRFQPACGECTACRRASSRQHPDLHFIAPTGNIVKTIKIEVIRSLQKSSISAPFEGRYRVVLIDQAHYMSEEAANALLKTLEEPPSAMLLILITDQPHRLLDTIRSRCQQIRFGALEAGLVSDALQKIYHRRPPYDHPVANPLCDDDEAPDAPADWEIPGEELFDVAAGYGEGSLGRSLEMLETGMLAKREELLSSLLSLDPRSQIQWLDTAQALNDSSSGLQEKLDLLTVFFRDLMLFKKSGPSRIVNRDLQDLIASTAPNYSVERILQTLDTLMEARGRVQRSVSAQLLAEDIVYRLRPGA